MPNRVTSETKKPTAMPQDEWDRLRVSLSAAEMKKRGFVVETTVECCKGDGTGCAEHDPDAVKVRTIREKSLKAALTAQDIADYYAAEIRAKAKGLSS